MMARAVIVASVLRRSRWNLKLSFVAVMLGCAVTIACYESDPVTPAADPGAVPAILVSGDDTARVSVPDTVFWGAPFTITVRTFAGGCTREMDRTEVEVVDADPVVEIRPYNEALPAGVDCNLDFFWLNHVAELDLASEFVGEYVVRVYGRAEPGGESVQLERSFFLLAP